MRQCNYFYMYVLCLGTHVNIIGHNSVAHTHTTCHCCGSSGDGRLLAEASATEDVDVRRSRRRAPEKARKSHSTTPCASARRPPPPPPRPRARRPNSLRTRTGARADGWHEFIHGRCQLCWGYSAGGWPEDGMGIPGHSAEIGLPPAEIG